jgi:hypothetical protein
MRALLPALVPSLVLLAACTQDFIIAEGDKIVTGGDTGAAPDDTGAPPDEEPVDTGDGGDGADGTDTTEGGSEGGEGGGGTDGADGADGTDGTDGGDEPVDDPAPEDDCDETSDLIYLIDKDTAELHLFDPATLGITLVGELDCDWITTPGSMGVARDGRAFVRYSDQTVYEVDLTTLTCAATSYSDRRTGFGAFGMGYATDDPTTWRDQLYIANGDEVALLDTATWTPTTVARLPSQAELTGNAAGELWAFLPLERTGQVRQIDQATGSTVQSLSVSGFPNPTDIDTFAFAAWGGELYAFVREYGMGSSTDVYRIESSGRMTVVASDIGLNVVGAGVSTCAPTTGA